MRRPIIAANWKMNKTPVEACDFFKTFLPLFEATSCTSDVVIVPPFTSLPHSSEYAAGQSIVTLGAQNMHHEASGAYTGEISPVFLKALGVEWVVLGHSERRQYFGETNAFINKKVLAALAHQLRPILCIGETLSERQAGQLEVVVREQLQGGLADVSAAQMPDVVLAYEPVWAIGTGLTATPAQAQEAHAFVRGVLTELFGADTAQQVRIQYGGSMKADNAVELMAQPDVDGGLIGGASLQPGSFFEIVKAAVSSVA